MLKSKKTIRRLSVIKRGLYCKGIIRRKLSELLCVYPYKTIFSSLLSVRLRVAEQKNLLASYFRAPPLGKLTDLPLSEKQGYVIRGEAFVEK